ncbi:GAF domain-containing SpoIIE family protein phosphatase [Fusobacterium sp. PH5-29]|uniref:GAF domain-containing SpoIIE family protein phosphatase n=1 Tax=Fusobacterium sp. PH5-29 TaxID=1742400 RepID=UPI003D1FEF76
MSFGILYRIKKKNANLIINLLRELRNGKESEKIPKFLFEEYNQTLDKIKEQKTKIEKSTEELKEYKKELELTYNALLIKSTQLENSNHMLERKIENLSNLNSISRAALSVLKVEKIINIIIDAYFVLTGVKRISLYLWENGTLINKKRKGGIKFDGEVSFSMNEIKNFARKDYQKIYADLSKGFYVNSEEIVMTYPLNVKGKELGVFYIIEDKNKLSYIDEETISALVIQISIAINNAQIYRDLLIKERISQELEVAAKIQRQIIPKDIDKICGLEIANYFEPAKEIGGDYYDYTILDDNSFSLTIADVSGKGVPAAFLLALGRSILKTLTIIGDGKPEDELNKLNRIIFPDLSEDMFITMFHSKYLRDERTLYYSNAGHNPIIIYRANTDEIELHNVKGVAIGFIEDYKYKSGQLKLYKGDLVLFYTDGLTEATNVENKLFGIENVKNIMNKNKEKSAIEVKNEILQSVKSFQGDAEQEDDLTFVVLKVIE